MLESRQAGELPVEVLSHSGVAGAEAHELEAVDRPVGARMADPHRAEADDKDPLAPAGRAHGVAQSLSPYPPG